MSQEIITEYFPDEIAGNVEPLETMKRLNKEQIRQSVKEFQLKSKFKATNKEIEKWETVNGKKFKIVYSKNFKLICPAKYINEFLEITHIHIPLNEWYRNIQKLNITFQAFHKRLLLFWQGCPECQSINKRKTVKNNEIINAVEDYGEQTCADVITVKSIKFLAILDRFTDFILLTKIKNETAEELKLGFIKLICTLAIPKEILTDNFPAFLAKPVQDLFNSLGIRHKTITPHNARSNKIERKFKDLQNVIKVFEENLDVETQVFIAQYVINNMRSSKMKISPIEALLFRESTAWISLPTLRSTKINQLSPEARNFYEAATKIRDDIQEIWATKKYINQNDYEFKKGEFVLIELQRNQKLKNATLASYNSKKIYKILKILPYTKTVEVELCQENRHLAPKRFKVATRFLKPLKSKLQLEFWNKVYIDKENYTRSLNTTSTEEKQDKLTLNATPKAVLDSPKSSRDQSQVQPVTMKLNKEKSPKTKHNYNLRNSKSN